MSWSSTQEGTLFDLSYSTLQFEASYLTCLVLVVKVEIVNINKTLRTLKRIV